MTTQTATLAKREADLYGLTRAGLAELIASWGFPSASAARLWKCLYREGVTSVDAMDELPARLRTRLLGEMLLGLPEPVQETHSSDGLTRKYVLRLHDGRQIETVLMRCHDRVTACLSSQAGCALGCVFCATGQMGFDRNLTTSEIVAQAMHVDRVLRAMPNDPGSDQSPRLRNVVLMGMGEPLLNYDAVMQAVDILRDSSGLAIAAKRITLSTVGVVPGIIRLADERRPYSLAVSLHAATQEQRAALIPAAHAWPLDALMQACRYYTGRLKRKIFFEWTLIEGENDSTEHAQSLVQLIRDIPAQINLIPLNPTAGYVGAPGNTESARQFQADLRERGIPATVRQRRGIDITAGCGQLARPLSLASSVQRHGPLAPVS